MNFLFHYYCWKRSTAASIAMFCIAVFLAAYAVVSFHVAQAATGINDTISFQGKVVNSDGTNVADGSYDFEFNLYTVSTVGSAVWTETWNSGTSQVTVTDGIFQVDLGTHADLPGSVDFNTDNIYLGVEFNGDGEMSPRIRLTSVPQAFNADNLDGVDGGSFLRSDTSDSFTSGTITFDDSTVLAFGTSDDFQITHNATNTVMTSATGDFVLDNTNATGSSIVRLGTDTSATNFQVQNNSESALFTVLGSGDATILGDLTITGDDITLTTNTAGYILVGDNTNYNPVAVSGDATLSSVGVLSIGSDKITETMLKAVDAAGDEECLTYESTGGDFEWQTCGGTIAADSLDYIDFEDTMDLDAALTLNQGTNTWTQNFTGTTTTGQTYNANSLTSGTALALSSTATAFTGSLGSFTLSGSNAANTGTVLTVANTGTLNTGVGLFLNNDAVAAIALDIDAENTSADIINISAAPLTTGIAIDISDLNALTTGTGVRILSNSASTGTRNLAFIHNDNTAATGTTSLNVRQDSTGRALFLDQDGNGIAFQIDSEATTQDVIDIATPTTTTGLIFDVNADALTTGKILELTSNSSSTGTRSLVYILNDNTAATGATALEVVQDSTQRGVFLDQNGNGIALSIDSEATTANAIKIVHAGDASNTAAALHVTAESGAGAGYFYSNAGSAQDAAVVEIVSDNNSSDQAALVVDQDGPGYSILADRVLTDTNSAAETFWFSSNAAAFSGTRTVSHDSFVIDRNAVEAGGQVVDSGITLYVGNYFGDATGDTLFIQSQQTGTAASVHVDHAGTGLAIDVDYAGNADAFDILAENTAFSNDIFVLRANEETNGSFNFVKFTADADGTPIDVFTVNAAGGLTAASTITFSSLNCTGNTNGGALTANGSGVISCSDDDGGSIAADSLDYIDFEDTMDLDAVLTLNQGAFTWTQNFTGTTTTGQTYNANSLTSGTALALSSTATSFTGSLGSFTLSGSNAANTGTVLKVVNSGTSNTGTAFMITNAAASTSLSLRVNDDGTDSDSTPFVVDAAGNVGIGTATPQSALQVSVSTSELGRIQTGGNTSGTTGAIFGYDALNSGRASITQLNNAGGSAATLALGFGAITSGLPTNTVLTLNQLGNVGIGTATPAYKLNIEDSDTSTNTKDIIGLLRTDSDSVGATGLGVGILFALEDSASNPNDAARLSVEWADATNGSEDAGMVISTMVNGTMTYIAAFDGIDGLTLADRDNVSLNFGNNSSTNTVSGGIEFARTSTGSACTSGAAQGIVFQTEQGTQSGHFCVDGTTGLEAFGRSWSATSTDLAENYSDSQNILEPGDVVALNVQGPRKSVIKSSTAYDQKAIGIVSTEPGFILSDIDEANGATDLQNPKPVALAGRVPTKVSTVNGEIKIGDAITSSSIPGVAMKATKDGVIIGKALENYSGSEVKKILVFVNTTWASPQTSTVLAAGLNSTGSSQPKVLGAQEQSGMQILTDQVTGISRSLTSVLSRVSQIEAYQAQAANSLISQDSELGKLLLQGVTTISGPTDFSNQVLFNGIVAFAQSVEFQGDVAFKGKLTVGGDSAGSAVVKKGSRRVDVTFKKPYSTPPVVQVTRDVSVSENASEEEKKAFEDEQAKLFQNYVVSRRSVNGFSIVLDSTAVSDVLFNWTALAVDGAAAVANSPAHVPSPEPTVSQVPVPEQTPFSASKGAEIVPSPEPVLSPSPAVSSSPPPSPTTLPATSPSATPAVPTASPII